MNHGAFFSLIQPARAAALLLALCTGSYHAAALAQAAAGLPRAAATQPALPASAGTSGAVGVAGGNTAAGAQIARQGVPGTAVAACAGCHGARGEGNAAAGFPRLAGQLPAYLAHQIESFSNGSRNNAVMSPIAKAMNAEQNRATAAYYASLDTGPAPAATGAPVSPAAPAPAVAGAGAAASARARMIAGVGDDAAQVQACANCHGPGGTGEGMAYPYLAGQHANYLASALSEWKTGKRNNDPSGQMQLIAGRLKEADITALAAYYATQPPPTRRSAVLASRQQVHRSPAGKGGPPAASPPPGAGTEQGSPTTGGSQGPGGGGGTTGTNPAGGAPPRPDGVR